jgi:hypothetical protein
MSARAMDGHEDEWQALNQGNPAALTYNDVDDAGVPINAPTRLSPPLFPSAYASGAQLAVNEMEASVGMYKSNLGQQSNAVSGRAKLADQREGDTANFHYIDNLRRSMEHMGRIIVGMIPVVYDTRRQAKILGEDGEQSQVEIDPGMEQAVRKQGGKVVAINPSVGAYDVRVKIGPSYSSMRTEASQRLVEISQGNPALGAALAPLLVKLNDMPEADKISKVAIALLPPNVQAVYAEDEQDDIPPAVKMQLDSQKQQIEQLTATLQQAGAMVQDLQGQVEQKNTSAMDQAKVVKTQLDAQEADIRNQQQLLAKDVQIAKLQIQAQQREAGDALNQQQQDLDTRTAEVEAAEAPLMDQNAIKELAAAIDAQQQLLAHALAQNTQAVQQLQSITVTAFESIEDMADVIAAPRQINLKFDKSGKATGATSVLDMPQGVLPEAAGQ